MVYEKWQFDNILEVIEMLSRREVSLKEKNRPRKLDQLKGNPIPYLQACSRLDIMEFILQLEKKRDKLKKGLQDRFPDLTPSEIEEKSRSVLLARGYQDIKQQSLSRLQTQVEYSMGQLKEIEEQNEQMKAQTVKLGEQCQVLQKKMIERERKKRELELKYKEKIRQEEAVDVSDLMGHLYEEIRGILSQEE